jgi:transcriptional regulator with PAS, ATPase and Fis domain
MLTFDWPGNIRELRNIIERAVALGDERQIITAVQQQRTMTHSESTNIPPEGIDLPSKIVEIEKAYIIEALKKTKGIGAEAARLLKINERTFNHYIGKYSLKEYIETLKKS